MQQNEMEHMLMKICLLKFKHTRARVHSFPYIIIMVI